MFAALKKRFIQSSQRSQEAVRNIIISMAAKCITVIATLLLVPLTIKYVNATQYGIWLTLSSIIAWVYFLVYMQDIRKNIKRLTVSVSRKFSNYIKILNELGLLQNIDILIPETQPDFKALYEQKPARQRVKSSISNSKSNWVWGEDK